MNGPEPVLRFGLIHLIMNLMVYEVASFFWGQTGFWESELCLFSERNGNATLPSGTV